MIFGEEKLLLGVEPNEPSQIAIFAVFSDYKQRAVEGKMLDQFNYVLVVFYRFEIVYFLLEWAINGCKPLQSEPILKHCLFHIFFDLLWKTIITLFCFSSPRLNRHRRSHLYRGTLLLHTLNWQLNWQQSDFPGSLFKFYFYLILILDFIS